MSDPTPLYYAFSTISQTLGGVLGLVAAFVVIRLSGLSSEIAKYTAELGAYVGWKPEWGSPGK